MPYRVLAPQHGSPDALCLGRTLPPFDPAVLEFIDAFSRKILAADSSRAFPELISMAHWMRKAHIRKLKQDFEERPSEVLRMGRGVVLHIPPSNVDTIFVYSWFLSMLAGNLNIVRISERRSPQTAVLLECINELCSQSQFGEVARRFVILTYGHEEEVTKHLSSLCDVRVIWGGDAAIHEIRRIPLKPHASEMTFADKASLSLIRASAFLELGNKRRLIDNFYNDAYWFNQMACASPRMVVWLGNEEDVGRSREIFWRMLEQKVMQERPDIGAAVMVAKLVAQYSAAIVHHNSHIEKSPSNMLNRIMVSNADEAILQDHCGGGLFFETAVSELRQVEKIITKKIQTIAVLGFTSAEIRDFMVCSRPRGIDRFVRIGEALTFSAHWDGYDLLREFCREVAVGVD